MDIHEPSTREADDDAPPSIPAVGAPESCAVAARCGAATMLAADGQAVEVAGPAGEGTIALTRARAACGGQLSWTLDVTATQPLQVHAGHLAVIVDGQQLEPAAFDPIDLDAGQSAQRTVVVALPAAVTCDAPAEVTYDGGTDQAIVIWSS